MSSLRGRKVIHTARMQTDMMVRAMLEQQSVLVYARPGVLPEERAEDVIGWICFLPTKQTAVIHYLYVRAPFRRMGIARSLVKAAGVDLDRTVFYTAETEMGDNAIAGAKLRAKYIKVDEVT